MFFQVLYRVLTSADLWQAALVFGTLYLLPALGGLISERSGVVNIAMEGMMLTGAYAAVATAEATKSLWVGVIGAMIAGGLMALIHAVVSINFKANQIVSGIAINIFALGLTNYLVFIQTQGQGLPSLPGTLRLPTISWGPLANIPFLGQVLVMSRISTANGIATSSVAATAVLSCIDGLLLLFCSRFVGDTVGGGWCSSTNQADKCNQG